MSSENYTKEFIRSLRLDEDQINELIDALQMVDSLSEVDLPPMLMIIENHVIDITPFLLRHPGGMHALLQYVGRDATKAFYGIHSTRAHQLLSKFIVGNLQHD